MYVINFGALIPYLGALAAGAAVTIQVSAATVAISFPLGLGGALVRSSSHRVLRLAVAAYVQAIRNVPLILVLFVLFFELPTFGIILSSFAAGVAGLSMNSVAYVIEIFRGGLAGIPRTQYEAGASLGLRPRQVLAYVVLPQLLQISFPALGNQVVGITLSSSVVFFIGLPELTSTSNLIGAHTFRYFEVFVVAGLFYVVASVAINRLWLLLGRRWSAVGDSKSGLSLS